MAWIQNEANLAEQILMEEKQILVNQRAELEAGKQYLLSEYKRASEEISDKQLELQNAENYIISQTQALSQQEKNMTDFATMLVNWYNYYTTTMSYVKDPE
jgi:hypothetical protein